MSKGEKVSFYQKNFSMCKKKGFPRNLVMNMSHVNPYHIICSFF